MIMNNNAARASDIMHTTSKNEKTMKIKCDKWMLKCHTNYEYIEQCQLFSCN